jgi:hypothetical protein
MKAVITNAIVHDMNKAKSCGANLAGIRIKLPCLAVNIPLKPFARANDFGYDRRCAA